MEPSFVDLSTSWRWVVSFAPQLLYPQYPPIRGWLGPRTGLDDVEKILDATRT
jgi:hypothetical protein